MMTLDILICTIGEGIRNVPDMLLAPRNDVRYVVSWQVDNPSVEQFSFLTEAFSTRRDVEVYTLEGKGLSRNRNNALEHAGSDICMIADDDCKYTDSQIDTIIKTYERSMGADLICFEAIASDGTPLKKYPNESMEYSDAVRSGYYPSSVEITFRRSAVVGRIEFNELFGLGSAHLNCGEESVFLHDALRKGLVAVFVPEVICTTSTDTTGIRFLSDIKAQRSKGAVFRYVYGRFGGLWHCLKEVCHHTVFNHSNPIFLLKNMLYGYNYCNSNIQS